jgi:hypothetical protein
VSGARPVARLVLLAGGVAIALLWFRGAPKDVVLVYGLGEAPAESVDVEIARGPEVVRRAWLKASDANPRHEVKLPAGDYVVRVRIAAPGRPEVRAERPISVRESETIVLPLASAR